jgi:hypothetical protein
MTRLPEEECAFYFAALGQIEPEQRLEFMARVTGFLDALSPFCEPGPGDIDRAIRQAFAALWTPPPDAERKVVGRWHRSDSNFDRVSKMAQPVE